MMAVRTVLGQWVKAMGDVIWGKPRLMFSLIVIGNILFMVAVEQVRLSLQAMAYLRLAVPDLSERLLHHHFLFAALLVGVVWGDLKLMQFVRWLVSRLTSPADTADHVTCLAGDTGSGTSSFAQRVVYNLRATTRRLESGAASGAKQQSPARYRLAPQAGEAGTPRRNPPRPNKYRPG